MTDEPEPYLILHRVRGLPAFDIARRLTCTVCNGSEIKEIGAYLGSPCDNCEDGHIWLIPTSGHRAYPWHTIPLGDLAERYDSFLGFNAPFMPEGWPDHYACNNPSTKSESGANLLDRLGLTPKVERRF
jgi:hypothetical protein